MRRRLALTAIGAAVLALTSGTVVSVATAAPASATVLPKTISLPNGYQPEGIAISGVNFYVGSLVDGRILRGNVLTGRLSPFVPGAPGESTAGLEVSGHLLFAAGAASGELKVYDLRSGRKLAERRVAPAGASFINDVAVTKDGAFYTDSLAAQLYELPFGHGGRFGRVRTLPTPGITIGPGFNANGIETTPDGRNLLVIQSNTGILFRVSPGPVSRRRSTSAARTSPTVTASCVAAHALRRPQRQQPDREAGAQPDRHRRPDDRRDHRPGARRAGHDRSLPPVPLRGDARFTTRRRRPRPTAWCASLSPTGRPGANQSRAGGRIGAARPRPGGHDMRRRLALTAITGVVLALISGTAVSVAAAAPADAALLPKVISLPNGFAARGHRHRPRHRLLRRLPASTAPSTAATCSPGGARSRPRDGWHTVARPQGLRRLAVRGRRPERHGRVTTSGTGRLLCRPRWRARASFVNDVVVTRDAAYFTDSIRPGHVRPADWSGRPAPDGRHRVPLTGDTRQYAAGFNANGIVASARTAGRWCSCSPTRHRCSGCRPGPG